MLCLYFLTRIVYILLLTILKQWMLPPLIWGTAKYSYPCRLQYYRKIYVSTRYTAQQLNSLTSIDLFSWLGGPEVTHPTGCESYTCLIPGFGNDFYVCFFVWLLLCVFFVVQNTLFVMKVCNSCCNFNAFSILNILQNLWPIIRVSRYRPSIFNIYTILCISAG